MTQVASPSPVAFAAPELLSEPSTPPFVTPAKGRKGGLLLPSCIKLHVYTGIIAAQTMSASTMQVLLVLPGQLAT